MVFAFSVPAVAGDYKCDGTTQECLDKMTAKLQKSGWVGIKLDETDDGRLVVKEVIADSPAKAAGFRSGDILVAMNGIEYAEENHKKMMADKETQRPGSKVTYTVERNGKRKDLSAKLAKVPQDVLAQWVGGHMLQHAEVEIAQN
jgi:C-terminal processing protease CtpA/Prc